MGEKQMQNMISMENPANEPARAPTRLRKFLTFDEFKRDVADWSKDTIMRRARGEGFPIIKDVSGYLIPTDEMLEWFKKRTMDPKKI